MKNLKHFFDLLIEENEGQPKRPRFVFKTTVNRQQYNTAWLAVMNNLKLVDYQVSRSPNIEEKGYDPSPRPRKEGKRPNKRVRCANWKLRKLTAARQWCDSPLMHGDYLYIQYQY